VVLGTFIDRSKILAPTNFLNLDRQNKSFNTEMNAIAKQPVSFVLNNSSNYRPLDRVS
jgi:hypothetical protein